MVQITVLIAKLKDYYHPSGLVAKPKTLNEDLLPVSKALDERMIAKQEILLSSINPLPQLPLIEEKPEENVIVSEKLLSL